MLRQDHYECAVLFLMRGARLDICNKNNQLPADCMVTKDVQCRTVVRLSTMLQGMMRPGSGLPVLPGARDPSLRRSATRRTPPTRCLSSRCGRSAS